MTLSSQYFVKSNVVEDVNVLKTMFRVLSFANANAFLSRNLARCKIQVFSQSFLVRKYSINGQFPQILRKFAERSAETVCLQNISRIVYGKACISQGAFYNSYHIFQKYSLNFASHYINIFG